jgi:LPXTG-site transpeptidase (sortase) family protein
MSDDKKYPKSSPGVARLLHLNEDNTEPKVPDSTQEENATHSSFAEKTAPAPEGLPIAIPFEQSEETEAEETEVPKESVASESQSVLPTELKPINSEEIKPGAAESKLEALELEEIKPNNPVWNWVKFLLPWVAIFGIGLGLYFFYFSDFSFYSLFSSDKLKIESVSEGETKNANLEQLKKDVAADYRAWVTQFFADVTDESIIAMDADVSGNGLTNLEKYLLNLNPKVYSTRGGNGDGQLVLDGINPWTGKTFTDKQKQLIEKYINPELISNRITAAAITRGVTKYAQYVNPDSPYYIDPTTLSQLGDGSEKIVSPTQIATTNNTSGEAILYEPTVAQPPVDTPPTLAPNKSIDESKPGLLEIPANSIKVPIIWTQDTKDFDADLKKGVVHYPGTPLPGEIGTSYISGHSSGYVWDQSPYKNIFTKLGSVADGTSFTITATQKDGKTVKFNYVIERRAEFKADDQAQFISTAESIVALSTCWPVGTVDRRLVLFAKLTQTERE